MKADIHAAFTYCGRVVAAEVDAGTNDRAERHTQLVIEIHGNQETRRTRNLNLTAIIEE